MTAYQRLTEQFARIATLNEAAAMLGWDAAAMMPAGGGAARGEQISTLAGLSHELLTPPAHRRRPRRRRSRRPTNGRRRTWC